MQTNERPIDSRTPRQVMDDIRKSKNGWVILHAHSQIAQHLNRHHLTITTKINSRFVTVVSRY